MHCAPLWETTSTSWTTKSNKLVAYTDGQRPITTDDIQLLTPHARQANIFDMVDALGRRDGKTASHIYHQLLDAGDHPLALLGMITRQFRLMIQVQDLAPQLGSPQAIARELGQNPYPITKILAQSKNYTPAQLVAVYHKLLDTDVDIKTGQMEPTLALDTFIAGLSRVALTRYWYQDAPSTSPSTVTGASSSWS